MGVSAASWIHPVLALALSPLLPGVINRVKAFFAGRNGPPLLQGYHDLWKLFRKGGIASRTTTWVFRAGPLVNFACLLAALAVMPLGAVSAPLPFDGDWLLMAYLLGLGRFFTVAAALDTGSSFEGMGASREVQFAVFAEPALLIGLAALARETQSLSLSPIYAGLAAGGELPLRILLGAGFFILYLAENCRIPVDDPNTHLELTMIHEVMVLDHSGPLLGLILYGASIKLFVIGAVLLHVLFPFQSGSALLDWGVFVAEMLGVAVAVGVVESTMARLQMRHVPYLLIAAILFCAFGFVLLVR